MNPLHRSWWTEHSTALWLAGCQLVFESLAVYSWLALLAAYGSGSATQAAIAWWAIAVITACFAIVAGLAQRLGAAGTIGALIAIGLLAWLAALRLSPLMYGGLTTRPLDPSWLARLATDLVSNPAIVSTALGIGCVIGYCGWRGLRLSHLPSDDFAIRRRWLTCLIIVLVACAGAVSVTSAAQPLLVGELGLCLGAVVFFGLMGTMLASEAAGMRPGDDPSGAFDIWRWQVTSFVLAALVVGVTLLLSAALNLESATAVLHTLGPVGAGISAVYEWIINAIGAIFYFLASHFPLSRGNQPTTPIQPLPTAPTQQGQGQSHSDTTLRLISSLTFAILVTVFFIIAALVIVRQLMQKEAKPESGVTEEREALDGLALWRGQVAGARDALLARFRSPERTLEPLPQQSVRAIYRDLLRRTLLAGVERTSDETPDEFAARLGQTHPSTQHDLADVTEAYDLARYGEEEAAPERIGPLRDAARRVVAQLRRNGS